MSADPHAQEPPPDAGPPPWTGPWADDARRLFRMVQAAVDDAGTQAPGASGYEHPPECLHCPFCQGVALLRRAGPDVLDQVSEFAAGLAATLRASPPDAPGTGPADPRTGPADGEPPGGREGDTIGGPARPPSTVRIDVTD